MAKFSLLYVILFYSCSPGDINVTSFAIVDTLTSQKSRILTSQNYEIELLLTSSQNEYITRKTLEKSKFIDSVFYMKYECISQGDSCILFTEKTDFITFIENSNYKIRSEVKKPYGYIFILSSNNQ